MTEEERYQIYEMKLSGLANNQIAAHLKRSPGTLSREIRRNTGRRGYRPHQANSKAHDRLSYRGKSNANTINSTSWEYAKKHLIEDQWSPEQIAGRLKLERLLTISPETIYQKILEDKKSGGDLYIHLRCKKKRKKRYGSNHSRRGTIPGRVDIDQRPAIVDSRKRIGDWEGDTIIGSHTGGAVIASMVERKSRFTCLVKSQDKTTVAVIGGINKCMQPISNLVHTITLDNGREFSQHKNLTEQLEAKVFFAKPYHSWERGLNENTNGLVRQYFPKKVPFDNITNNELRDVAKKINNRPRKCLDYKTPFEVFSRSCKRIGIALRI